ncbi:peptidylprolyl isomerase [Marivirga harenae]|uniref:peptidylprolyl isomerase n=1 Tax=Marivirga harenae TaxID=2010992 RepID=UPI0026DF341F|nr:peptidylprolyl isomerase [Marivirga harenae]WKV13764.1 peptidylprolyl isomerase [Marivirga harenae]|tara:strand:- start:61226 stop:62578 length:1353 start_codon:yes stop_codon:yes gene_type:complete
MKFTISKNKSIALLLAFLVLPLLSKSQSEGEVVDKIIAKVDNYIILESDLSLAYKDFLSRGGMTRSPEARCEVLENLVINKLMLAKAEIDSVTVSEAQVDAQVQNRMKMMVQQIGSEEKIEEYYGKTLEEFQVEIRGDVREQMIIGEMQRTITSDIEVTPRQVKTFFDNIPRDSLPFYSTQVQVGQIVKKPTMSKEAKDNIRARLNGLRDRILEGENFDDIARLYSQEPGAKQSGGNIGFFERGQLAPEYEATALRLKPGEISKPVETDFGFHIIELLARRGNEFNTRHILILPKFTKNDMDRTINFLDSIRTLIIKDSITFEAAAAEHSDDMNTSSNGGYFMEGEAGGTKISVDELDPNVFFTIDTMEVGSITKPIEFRQQDRSEAVRILYYKDRIRPHRADIRIDYQKIKQAALNKKRSEKLAKWFEESKSDVFIVLDDHYKDCQILN